MTPPELLAFARRHRLAVEASTSAGGAAPQALVVGWDLDVACTLQIEGLADEPSGEELEALQAPYFAAFPDGVERKSWPGITYFRVRPTWMRFSDFTGAEPRIVELDALKLAGL